MYRGKREGASPAVHREQISFGAREGLWALLLGVISGAQVSPNEGFKVDQGFTIVSVSMRIFTTKFHQVFSYQEVITIEMIHCKI